VSLYVTLSVGDLGNQEKHEIRRSGTFLAFLLVKCMVIHKRNPILGTECKLTSKKASRDLVGQHEVAHKGNKALFN